MPVDLIDIAKILARAVANKDYSEAVVDAGFLGEKSLADAVSQGFFDEEGNLESPYRSTYSSALERTKFQQIPITFVLLNNFSPKFLERQDLEDLQTKKTKKLVYYYKWLYLLTEYQRLALDAILFSICRDYMYENRSPTDIDGYITSIHLQSAKSCLFIAFEQFVEQRNLTSVDPLTSFKTFCADQKLVEHGVIKVVNQLKSQLPDHQKSHWRRVKLISSIAASIFLAGVGAGLIATGFFAPLGVGLLGYGVVVGAAAFTGLTIGFMASSLISIARRKKKVAEPIQSTIPHLGGHSQAYIESAIAGPSRRLSRADLDEELSRALLSAESAAIEARIAQTQRIAADALIHNAPLPTPFVEVRQPNVMEDSFK